MMECRYHPDREASVVCQKMGTGYCESCMDAGVDCIDPTAYCKFRTQCMVWELEKERKRSGKEEAGESEYPHAVAIHTSRP